jgi:hypothetical protein
MQFARCPPTFQRNLRLPSSGLVIYLDDGNIAFNSITKKICSNSKLYSADAQF